MTNLSRGLVALLSLMFLLSCGTSDYKSSKLKDDPGIDKLQFFMEKVDTPPEALKQIKKTRMFHYHQSMDIDPVVIYKIINIGKAIWNVVEQGRPVVNVAYDYATAVPEGIKSINELYGFSELQDTSYRVYAKNLYGITVFDLTYTLVHQYNGSYNGHGKYLVNMAVVPTNLKLLWGFKTDFKVTNLTTTNVGTKKDPIASGVMELNLKVSSAIVHREQKYVFQFRGDKADVLMIH